MFCPNCGKQLPEGSRFCDACGTKVADINVTESTVPATETAPASSEAPVGETAPAVSEAPVSETASASSEASASETMPASSEAPASETVPAANTTPAAEAVPAASEVPVTPATPTVGTTYAAGATAAPVTPGNPDIAQPKKKGNGKAGMYAVIGVAAVVLIVIIVGLVSLLSSSGSSGNAYAYISNGKYELIKNLKKGDSIEISSSRSDITRTSLLQFSPDGKYVYYYTKYDSSSRSGSLNRAEFAKLKDNSGKNEKYIETIATNVRLGFEILEDGSIIYQNASGNLYHYNGKEPNQIGKSVESYYTVGSRYVVYTTGSTGDNSIYGVDLKDIDNKIKLASNCYNLYYVDDVENIYYTKRDDEYNESLYVVGFNKDSEKLGDEVSILGVSDGTVYYASSKGNSVSLYDYVTDEYRNTDEGITEPNIEDFGTPKYTYSKLSRYNNADDYDELYASCTQGVSFYSSWFSYRSIEYMAQNEGDETKKAKCQEFVDKYKDQEDEDGFFLVTDSVLSDIMSLAQVCGSGYDNEWLGLCFRRYQSGTSYDYDAYYEKRDVYNEARERIRLREALMDSENDYPVYTMYAYKDGKTETIGKDIFNWRLYSGAILYNTADLVTKKIDIEEILEAYGSVWTVVNLFSLDYDAENYLVILGDTKANQMSESAADALGEANESGYARLYAVDGNVYMSEENGALSAASVNNGKVEKFTLVTDDAQIMGVYDSVLYYASGIYTRSGDTYGDVYSYSKGKSERLAQDVLTSMVVLYDDDVVIAATDYNRSRGYEIVMINSKGDSTNIADNITQLIRVDKNTLLYISDDDLYYYNGKEKSMVAEDVDCVWSLNDMDGTFLSY